MNHAQLGGTSLGVRQNARMASPPVQRIELVSGGHPLFDHLPNGTTARKLHLGLGYPSLFVYCTQSLHLSESAAYARITAARASRSFPNIVTLLADGAVTLTTISLLAGHLTEENNESLLSAASHKSRRDVERLIASLVLEPAFESSVRRLPDRSQQAEPVARPLQPALVATPHSRTSGPSVQPRPIVSSAPARRPVVAPIGAEKYLLRVTLSATAHEKFERARALLRHQVPTGDPAVVMERALSVLVDQLERVKHAAAVRPRTTKAATASTTRYVPATVKRAVWKRDGGRCAFVGTDGRCGEFGFLEFHHVTPFAAGGATDAANLELRCRAHNAYEAALFEQSSETAFRLL